jgi:hypothetical protein
MPRTVILYVLILALTVVLASALCSMSPRASFIIPIFIISFILIVFLVFIVFIVFIV